MTSLKNFGIFWTLVVCFSNNWSTFLTTASVFVNSKKSTMINKSEMMKSSTILDLLSNDLKKVQKKFDTMTEKFDKLEPFLSNLMKNKLSDKNFINNEINLALESPSNDTLTNLRENKNHQNGLENNSFKDKLERVSRIQERNSQLLVIQMSSLTNLEENLSRLEKLINSTGSTIDKHEIKNSSSFSNYEEQVIDWLSKIDKKLSNICENVYDTKKKNNESVNENRKRNHDLVEKTTGNDSYKAKRSIRSCESLRNNGDYNSGVYSLDKLDISMNSIWGNVSRINCDLRTNGGGWTIIQRRGEPYGGRVNFNRSWNDYANGFGDLDGEFWFGNEVVHRMTSYHGKYELRIELEDWDNETAWAQYSIFELGPRMDGYRIKIAGYTGNATDSLSAHYSTPFSTYDRRNDFSPQCCPCTSDYGGGWWYYSCFEANLNGNYYNMDEHREPYRGIIWEHWRDDYSLKKTKMMIRLKDPISLNSTW